MHRHLRAAVSMSITLVFTPALTACLQPEQLGGTEQSTNVGDLGSALGFDVATGTTTGLSNDTMPLCTSSNAPDATYTWTAPSAGAYIFTTLGSTFDTVLEVFQREDLHCNDDSNGTLQSTVNVRLAAGERVGIVIDGFSTANGNYQLNIARISTDGLQLWLRGDAGITTSSRVGVWADQSGNGRNAVMSVATRQPFFAPGTIAGWPTVRFTGAESMTFASEVAPTGYTIFIVGRNTNSAETFSIILGPSGNLPNNQLRWDNGTQALFVDTAASPLITTSTIGNTRVFHALAVRHDGLMQSVYRDGNLVSSITSSLSGPWRLGSLGSFYSDAFLHGDIAEILVYARPLAEAERLEVNDYLRNKYHLP